MNDKPQTCGHAPDVSLTWLSHNGPVRQNVCEPCAAIIWNAMPQPIRETFSICELTR